MSDLLKVGLAIVLAIAVLDVTGVYTLQMWQTQIWDLIVSFANSLASEVSPLSVGDFA